MRFLLRAMPESPRREEFLRSVRSLALGLGAEVRNPKWTSQGALEIDVFARSEADFGLFLAAIEPVANIQFTADLNSAPPHRDVAQAVGDARELFNAERYWEAHEVLEGAWRTLSGQEKSFVQGVILVCAAFVHHQKGEDDVGLGVLSRAAKQLDFPGQSYHSLDLGSLSASVGGILESRRFEAFHI